METKPSDLPAAGAAGACPRWVMLNRHSHWQFADATTTTSSASHTSMGHLFRLSFRLAAPPACSSFYSDWAGSEHVPNQDPHIVASHGDCLLLDVLCPNPNRMYDTFVTDYFLYNAGSGAAQPMPTLSLLPACFFPMTFDRSSEDTGRRDSVRQRYMWKENTGILRCGGSGEVTVVQLEVPKPEGWKFRDKAELCVLDTVRLEWELHRDVSIVHGEATASKAEELMLWWETDVAVPVGNRFLCFVDYFRGFLLCDMEADVEALGIRYVPLPVEAPNGCPYYDDDRPCMPWFRNLAAAGTGAVRFVTVESRCCCGAAGKSTCEGGQFLFTVTTWTLNLATDEEAAAAEWVKDGTLDCEEIWAMPGYDGLPRRQLTFPIFSCDDPDTVCFMVSNVAYGKDRKVWMLEIDIRSKTLRSVAPYNNVEDQARYQVAVKLQC
ncbi:unnamed protein product [Urochloa humidicola]